ncbi:MAG: ECF transporter S component [Tissierellia bacterium]|mgnify:CR=1 FL=1|nr:ECF transporter S component [Tissierellia bacterium]
MKSRNIVLSGLFIALGVLLPIVFHQFNMGGPVFLPMHIPVLMAGLLLGPIEGLLVGVITPIISSLLTGMPPLFPMLPIMIAELGTYGLTSGYFSKKLKVNTYISLIAGMIDGRIAAGIMVFILANFFGFNSGPLLYLKGAIMTGLPGIIIQLLFIPPIVRLLKRDKVTFYS